MAHLTELDWAHLSSRVSPSLPVRWHLLFCVHCRKRRAELRQERAAFFQSAESTQLLSGLLARLPAAPAHAVKARPTSRNALQRVMWGVSFASCAVVLAVLAGRLASTGDDNVLRPKGSPLPAWSLLVGGNPEPFVQGNCRPGDVIQGRYRASEPGYLLVLGVDSEGLVQQLFPDSSQVRSAPISPGQKVLPEGWRLDETSGKQRFIAVFSRVPLTFADVRKRLGQEPVDLARLPADSIVRVAECEVRP